MISDVREMGDANAICVLPPPSKTIKVRELFAEKPTLVVFVRNFA